MEKKNYNIRLDGIEIIEKFLFRANIQDESDFHFDIKADSVIHGDDNLVIMFVGVDIRKQNETELLGKILVGVRVLCPKFKRQF
jgi:hypothetical protein